MRAVMVPPTSSPDWGWRMSFGTCARVGRTDESHFHSVCEIVYFKFVHWRRIADTSLEEREEKDPEGDLLQELLSDVVEQEGEERGLLVSRFFFTERARDVSCETMFPSLQSFKAMTELSGFSGDVKVKVGTNNWLRLWLTTRFVKVWEKSLDSELELSKTGGREGFQEGVEGRTLYCKWLSDVMNALLFRPRSESASLFGRYRPTGNNSCFISITRWRGDDIIHFQGRWKRTIVRLKGYSVQSVMMLKIGWKVTSGLYSRRRWSEEFEQRRSTRNSRTQETEGEEMKTLKGSREWKG